MAVLGRWTTTDPILMEQGPNKLLKDGKVQAFSMSAYNYSFNNPINLRDESGKWPTPWDIVDFSFAAQSIYAAWSDPSTSNIGWATFDVVAAAAPGLPSSGYFRGGAKLLTQGDDIVNVAKSSLQGVKLKQHLAAVEIIGESALSKPSLTKRAPQKLQNVINQLFKGSDEIPGGTAGAIRYTKLTKNLVGGSDHLKKGEGNINALRKILDKGNLNKQDRAAAERVLNDLEEAMDL